MSTFNLLIILFLILLFGIRLFMYCVDIELPMVSEIITLILFLMLIAELILAIFEFPAIIIDGILLICMGNKVIAIGCGVVIAIVALFVFIIVYPKIKWKKILSFSLIKYAVIGFLLIGSVIYTELFNGSYSFRNMEEYNEFKQEFSVYDNHFWPTKFIRKIEDNGKEILTITFIYPWDVSLVGGKQFAYKVETYYDESDISSQPKLYYYPFTYYTYERTEKPRPIDGSDMDANNNEKTVTDSDLP
jgi:hypothetical protein